MLDTNEECIMKHINIAIDGPSGAGKSTAAKAVAAKLGIIYLDTGAMYRAVAYYALKHGVDPLDGKAVEGILDGIEMDIVYRDGVQEIWVSGENVTPYLREAHMSKAASDISAHPAVRLKLVELQRKFARENDVVLDGRDIGTYVLPDASCKIFLTADTAERAKRRWLELAEKGNKQSREEVRADIEKRDYNDSHRAFAPLKQAEDAVLLDTTDMTVEQVVGKVIEIAGKAAAMETEK